MKDIQNINLCHDPIHGYIPFVSYAGVPPGEVSERALIDHPWLQRMRHIHQLQTAWWVYPTAEHTRFQHVVGVMHLASRVTAELYDSLREICPDVPSQPCVESLLRIAGLLHDVGHGPYGHFFDDHFLKDFGLTHETLGGEIIRRELSPLIQKIRRTPNGVFAAGESLVPDHVAWLIARPRPSDTNDYPKWLCFLRSLLSGVYTIDNMDFVLRDAYMTGYNTRIFDLARLLHYSFFSEKGLTINDRGIDALVRFIGVRAELFQSVYFHRTVRALDLSLEELFEESKHYLFDGNPAENLDKYLKFTEWTMMVDVGRWVDSDDPAKRQLGERWQDFLNRRVPWKMICQRNMIFKEGQSERMSLLSQPRVVERMLREALPDSMADTPIRVDIPRHIYRRHAEDGTNHQNFMYDSARDRVQELTEHHLFAQLPISHRICRVYATSDDNADRIAAALDSLIQPGGQDDLTNM